MANTTKENVLIIAPELAAKVNNVAKQVLVSISVVANATVYSVIINRTTYSITSAATGATASTIAAQLVAAISPSTVVLVLNNGNGTFLLISNDAEVAVTLYISANMTSQVTVENHLGDTLFNMILADCIIQVTEDIFETEQERAQRYLMAHLLSLYNPDTTGAHVNNDVIREIVGDVEFYTSGGGNTTQDTFFGKTVYGVIYLEIYHRHFFRFV